MPYRPPPPYPNFGVPYNQYQQNPMQRNPQRPPVVHANQNFSYPAQNVSHFNQQPFEGYQRFPSQNTPVSCPPNSGLFQNNNISSFSVNNSVTLPPPVINNEASLQTINSNLTRMPPPPPVFSNFSQNFPTQWKDSFGFNVPPPTLQSVSPCIVPPPTLQNVAPCIAPSTESMSKNALSEKEQKLAAFLQKHSSAKQDTEKKLALPEYRSKLIAAFSILNLLNESKSKLQSLLNANANEWNFNMQHIAHLKKQLSELCTFICSDDNLSCIVKKLNCIKRKRDQKKKTKLNKLSEKIKAEQKRKELNQQIDKWLDDIKEKNLKMKREVEMKKEADFILLEVRRKIQEANRTIEKIKMLEKLRNARQINAVQKGLRIQPEHNENFEKKMFLLKETMMHQLADYEAEEKALKVMLETEQEGQREEIVQWEIKKMKTLQQKRQNHITERLFGNSEDPLPTDPLYLFHKFQTSANSSIESLIQIRHQWDMHIADDGEAVSQQWVVPVTPSSSLWEKCLTT